MRQDPRTLPRALALLLLSGAACTHPPPSAMSQRTPCEGLRARTVEGATLTGSTLVAATSALPEYCELKGMLPPSLHFEVRLPTAWNGRTVYNGGGGYDGFIIPGDEYIARGYASVASDGGHTGGVLEGSFAADPAKLDDFAFLSVHRVLPVARALIREHYGRDATKTWFEGCSNGGREGLSSAQRWPEDFDGIIVHAPAYDFVEMMLAFNHHTQRLVQPGAMASPAQLANLGRALLAACDAKDGLADGIISHPTACPFDPAVVQCQGAGGNDCLTPAQVASARALAAPYVLDGKTLHRGWGPGDAVDPGGWSPWLSEDGKLEHSAGHLFSQDLIRYFITQDPSFDALSFKPSEWRARIDAVTALVSANDTDLSRFRARGGKLILRHGGSDGIITQRGTDAYYEALVRAAGGQEAADTFVEYFPAPGVNHCSGGAGPSQVDLLSALEGWVERGVPPSQTKLVAHKRSATGESVLSRPVCKYPRYPRYTGSGDETRAESFTCVEP
ncbi:tannase/feruloyl esterase family alpha/beta hydrolase [Archangium lansingense]|uniref:Tannase/feruloyl esterase family alpha/beta hydrolase n=1 Tax=Archangium lansingense TaxID=2995310 RepID=A0ABT4A203_9BACT|nr:tannase/feruloyl esterase family alpha/beta hydrolase [Archangium lansinium]MCY1075678.1 tannase/feruloyl esterase family alpha/beta hydrolase [Archangium lansinium]